jgi:hypothetical protein
MFATNCPGNFSNYQTHTKPSNHPSVMPNSQAPNKGHQLNAALGLMQLHDIVQQEN